MRELKPPAPLRWADGERTVFLAGSIDLGAAVDWQARVTAELAGSDWVVLNPRRETWDEAGLRAQVEWELEAQERCTCIAMYFSPGSKAPITLLELGLFARSGRLRVCCAEDYWRRGNVEIVCARYGVPLLPSLEALISEIRGAPAGKAAES